MHRIQNSNTAAFLALATLASGGCSSLGSLQAPERDRAAAAERLSGEPLRGAVTDARSILNLLAERLYPSLRRLERIEIERPANNPERPNEIAAVSFDPRGHLGGFEVTFKTLHGEQTAIPLRGTYSVDTFEGIDGSSISTLRLSFRSFFGSMDAEFSQVQPASDRMWETLYGSPPAVSAKVSVAPSLPGKILAGIHAVDMKSPLRLELTSSLPATLKALAERELSAYLTEKREAFGNEEAFRAVLNAAASPGMQVRIFGHPMSPACPELSREQLRSHILTHSSAREGARSVYVYLGHPASTPLSRVVAADSGGLWVVDAAGFLTDAFAGRHVAWEEIGKSLSGAPLVSDERLHLTVSETGPRRLEVQEAFDSHALSEQVFHFTRGVEKAERLFGLPKGALVIRFSSSEEGEREPLPVGVVRFRGGDVPVEHSGYASAVKAICFAQFIAARSQEEQTYAPPETVSDAFLKFASRWADVSSPCGVTAAAVLVCSLPEAMEMLQNSSPLTQAGFGEALRFLQESTGQLPDPSELRSLIAFGREQLDAWRPEGQASRVLDELLQSLEQLR